MTSRSVTSDATAQPFFPTYTKAELRVDLGIHITGLVLAAVGIPLLLFLGLWDGADTRTAVALPLYATGLLAMFSFSMLYNHIHEPAAKEILRRFDHAAIFLMIAGTYSPFALAKIGGPWGLGLFVVVWGLAVSGAVIAFAFPRKADRLIIVLCLTMGWSIVAAINPLIESVNTVTLVLLVAGGVTYTVGVIFHLAQNMKYHNAIWHGCVLAAAICHYVAILNALVIDKA